MSLFEFRFSAARDSMTRKKRHEEVFVQSNYNSGRVSLP